MHGPRWIGLLALCAAVSAFAQEPAAPATPTPEAAPVTAAVTNAVETPKDAAPAPAETPEDSLAQSIKQSASLRDPFWPIGYKPPVPGKKKVVEVAPVDTAPKVDMTPRWEEALKTISVNGIMKAGDGSYMAVINGKICAEKDTVSVDFRDRKYTWRVTTIGDSGVQFHKVE